FHLGLCIDALVGSGLYSGINVFVRDLYRSLPNLQGHGFAADHSIMLQQGKKQCGVIRDPECLLGLGPGGIIP
ncbi:MAG: hypothetical protein ACKO7V_10405, partial [Bacteroidota bacterium]